MHEQFNHHHLGLLPHTECPSICQPPPVSEWGNNNHQVYQTANSSDWPSLWSRWSWPVVCGGLGTSDTKMSNYLFANIRQHVKKPRQAFLAKPLLELKNKLVYRLKQYKLKLANAHTCTKQVFLFSFRLPNNLSRLWLTQDYSKRRMFIKPHNVTEPEAMWLRSESLSYAVVCVCAYACCK